MLTTVSYKTSWSGLVRLFELNASKFFGTTSAVISLKALIEAQFDHQERSTVLNEENAATALVQFKEMSEAARAVGAELTMMSANRIVERLEQENSGITIGDTRDALHEIEGRLRDELNIITFIVLNRQQKSLFGPANELVNWNISGIFPDAAREIEEACKCLALQRPTAAVFHGMRLLEIGLHKFAELLDVPAAVEAHEKNWSIRLRAIKDQLDTKYPRSKRLAGSEGAQLENIYASLDAVRNPWRNSTMHVDVFYTDSEAFHILQCVAFFLQNLAAHLAPSEVDKPVEGGSIPT